MALVLGIDGVWRKMKWPLFVAFAISAAGLFLPLPVWLRFLGLIGIASALKISEFAPGLNEGLAFFLGFLCNMLFWLFVFSGAIWLSSSLRRRSVQVN